MDGCSKRGPEWLAWIAVYTPVLEGFTGFIDEWRAAPTPEARRDEVSENSKEAVQLVLQANHELAARSFVGENDTRERFHLSMS